jgi:hypothetical protein
MAETLFRQWFVEEAGEDWGEGVLGDVIEIYDSKRVPLSKMRRSILSSSEDSTSAMAFCSGRGGRGIYALLKSVIVICD